MKRAKRPSAFTDLILNKDQTLIHLLILYLPPRDLRNLRQVSKIVEDILITNTKFLVKALWSPLNQLQTNHTDIFHSQDSRNYWKTIMKKEIGTKRLHRTFQHCYYPLILIGGLERKLNTFVIVRLETQREKYNFIKRRIKNRKNFEETTKLVAFTNGFKSPYKILIELEETAELIYIALQKLFEQESENTTPTTYGQQNTPKPRDLAIELVHCDRSLYFYRVALKRQINTLREDDFKYKRQPSTIRFSSIYCSTNLNLILKEIINIL